MIKGIIDMLALNEYYGVSERVEIVKGKYEYITSWKRVWQKIKRYYYEKN